MTDKQFKEMMIALVGIKEAIDELKESVIVMSKDVSEINRAEARILMFVESLHMWQTAAIAKGG